MSATPGPWFDYDEDGCITAELDLTDAGVEPEGVCLILGGPNAEANADLIMAAPETTAALASLLDELDMITWDSDGPPDSLVEAIEAARPVLRKAKGES